MSFLNSILKTFVGDKTKKDLSQITPLVAEINSHQKNLESLSHDELRFKTIIFKEEIAEERKSFDLNILKLLEEVKLTSNIDLKESLYQQID